MSNQGGLFKPVIQVTFFTVISVIVNILMQLILAAKFGARIEMDSYLAASVIPQFITVVIFSALNIMFIPIFIEYETKKYRDEVWKLASIIINLVFVVLFIISFIGIMFAPQIISLTAPGLKGEGFLLTVSLAKILFPSMIFGGLNSLIASIYYARSKFLTPSLAGVASGTLMLLFVIVFEPIWGIKSLAIGALVSSIAHLCVLAPFVLKERRYQFILDLSHEGVRKVIAVTWPLVVSGLFYRANTIIERMIASRLPEGSISYLGYSHAILSTLGGIVTGGLSTAIFPAMAKGWSENNLLAVREYFTRGIRIIMFLIFPIAALFVALRIPIVQLGFERGRFDHKATEAVSTILLVHLAYFICGAIGNVTGKGYYISQKTKLRAALGVIELIFYSSLAYILSRYFSYIGIAIALSMSYIISLPVDLFIMKRLYQEINGRRLFDALLRISAASLSSALFAYCAFNLPIIEDSLLTKLILTGTVTALLYLALMIYIFNFEEAIQVKDKIGRRIKKFLGVRKHQVSIVSSAKQQILE